MTTHSLCFSLFNRKFLPIMMLMSLLSASIAVSTGTQANAADANATQANATQANAADANATQANAADANATQANAAQANAAQANAAQANAADANAAQANAAQANAAPQGGDTPLVPSVSLGRGEPSSPAQAEEKVVIPAEINEGPCEPGQIIAGPFDIHRRYRSMEGPWAVATVRAGDLAFSGKVYIPEKRIHFSENENGASPSMDGGMSGSNGSYGAASEIPDGLIDVSQSPRKLLWIKGVKIEILDENDHVLPQQDLFCHANVEVDPHFRDRVFPEGERCGNSRLFTLTQGQTEFFLPSGFAVPIASDEPLRISLQAANRTTDKHERIKQRITFYFIKDAELVQPVVALHHRCGFVSVVVDKDSEENTAKDRKNFPHCDVLTFGVNAPNNVQGGTFEDDYGRRRSGHWVVPPGTHTYSSVLNEKDPQLAAKTRKLRAVWVHPHPLCTEVSLGKCKKDGKPFFTTKIATQTEGGLQIKSIKTEVGPEGVIMPKGTSYQLEGTYENTIGVPVDSMITAGMFFEDRTFSRPLWALADNKTAFCGVNFCKKSEPPSIGVGRTPDLFDSAKDGPILKAPVNFAVHTTAGQLNLVLDPKLAPMTATQIARLLEEGAFNGTPVIRYEPNFVIQIAPVQNKTVGAVGDRTVALLRKLPLEIESQTQGQVKHERFVLSLARFDDDVNSGESSFSILLSNAPHLDGKYTIFGHVADDKTSRDTIERITSDWDKEKPSIATASKEKISK